MRITHSKKGKPRHMHAPEEWPASKSASVDAARVAIWRLFEQGFVDEDMATAGLLAVDLGTRRAERRDGEGRSNRPRIGLDNSSGSAD